MGWLLFWVACAFAASAVAPSRGRRAVVWFLLCLFLTPLMLLILLCLPSVKPEDIHKKEPRMVRPCPFCAETILAQAKLCKHCKSAVEPASLPQAKDVCNESALIVKSSDDDSVNGFVEKPRTRIPFTRVEWIIIVFVLSFVIVLTGIKYFQSGGITAFLKGESFSGNIYSSEIGKFSGKDIKKALSQDFLDDIHQHIINNIGPCKEMLLLSYAEGKNNYVAYCKNENNKQTYYFNFKRELK